MAIAGDLRFNPLTDKLKNKDGQEVMLDEPSGDDLPRLGFDVDDPGYIAPAEDGSNVEVIVSPTSDRLQILEEFPAWDGLNITGARLLIKAYGKCTTDHISMAGPWLKYRGHLDNISNNMLIGAVNAFNMETNKVKNELDGQYKPVRILQDSIKLLKFQRLLSAMRIMVKVHQENTRQWNQDILG
jgi:aconitate hydratase